MRNSNPKPEVQILQEQTQKYSIIAYSRACRLRLSLKDEIFFKDFFHLR